jgi:hypothetical protein
VVVLVCGTGTVGVHSFPFPNPTRASPPCPPDPARFLEVTWMAGGKGCQEEGWGRLEGRAPPMCTNTTTSFTPQGPEA